MIAFPIAAPSCRLDRWLLQRTISGSKPCARKSSLVLNWRPSFVMKGGPHAARHEVRQGKQLFMLLGLEGEAAMSTAMYSDHMFKPFFFHFASATARLRCPVADNLSVAVAAVLRVLRMLFKLVQAPGFGKQNFRLSLLFAMPTMKRRGRFC